MNKKDLDLISEAYVKVNKTKATLQESFNYTELAHQILHAAEELMNDGVRHTFAEVWHGNEDYEVILERYIDSIKDLVIIASQLKKGDLEKVKKLYNSLDMVAKDHLPRSFTMLVDNLTVSNPSEEEKEKNA
jgi:hypothetical protein